MFELTEDEIKDFQKWSEGNKYLLDLLCSCRKSGMKTYASCGGHESVSSEPYLGIIIDDNSIPFIKSMLGQIQDMQNIRVYSGARHQGDGRSSI